MDCNYYCKNCGQKVEEVVDAPLPRIFKCKCTDALLCYQEVMAGFTRDARVNQLKAMHNLMCEANDENIYMTWIYQMPDCPSEEDFIYIALDDEQYNECFDLFVKLISKRNCRY